MCIKGRIRSYQVHGLLIRIYTQNEVNSSECNLEIIDVHKLQSYNEKVIIHTTSHMLSVRSDRFKAADHHGIHCDYLTIYSRGDYFLWEGYCEEL
jgi:hypothetical protein